ncbi:uncharacterized protein LOC109917169 [Rhincodon typus]|uniref:uncharacterized protein LOC109917169 n=1 Tax=Rhincodon typus TaxID=259920 RepID=UPI00203081B9|nr:uncharacterized protein LOC109917169 [Rhincodon typus]
MGPLKQLKKMVDPNRLYATIIMLATSCCSLLQYISPKFIICWETVILVAKVMLRLNAVCSLLVAQERTGPSLLYIAVPGNNLV